MPSWKKVITSGSDAALNSLNVTNGTTVSSSLNLTGSFNITGSIQSPNWINFKSGSDQPQAEGRLGWDDGYGTLNLGLKGGNVNLAIGQDQVARVYNADSVPLTDGMLVYISGSQGNRVAVKRASAAAELGSANTLGMVTEPIAVGAEGFITTQGVVNGLNTTELTAGALLYLSSSAGQYTMTRPTAPAHTVVIGYVERVHATVGSIYVKVDNGYEIGELHDVLDNTTSTSYGDLLVKSGSVWTNSRQLTGSYGLTGSLQATSFTGSLLGNATTATSASFASTASFVPNGITGTGTANTLPKFTANSALGNSIIYDNGTNVGIGTTPISEKLEVSGYIRATGFKTPTGTSTQFLKADGSVDANSYINTSHPVFNINQSNIDNWNAAYSWGNHASAGYLKSLDLSNYVTTNTPQTIFATKKYLTTGGNSDVNNSLWVYSPDVGTFPAITFDVYGYKQQIKALQTQFWFVGADGTTRLDIVAGKVIANEVQSPYLGHDSIAGNRVIYGAGSGVRIGNNAITNLIHEASNYYWWDNTSSSYKMVFDTNGFQVYDKISANSFVKYGSDNNYVLLGGGGHKMLSDFATSSHTHDFSSITSKPTTLSGYGITDAIPLSQKGVANGIATLGSNGLIPTTQLPSYVDDVLEFANLASFPATGESGKIYVALNTNLTYRWSGTTYVEISPSLALGETSETAYRGDRGKIAFDHSQTTGNPHGTTKSDIGLGNVDNTADATKNVLSATKWTTARTLTIGNTGKLVDGTGNVSWSLAEIGASPSSGSANYIQNQASSPQSANMWISGDMRSNSGIYFSPSNTDRALVRAEVGSGDFNIFQYDSGGAYLRNALSISNATGAATFASNITLNSGGYIYGDTTTPFLRLNQTNGTFLQYGNSGIWAAGSLTNIFSTINVTISTAGSERLRVDSNGNVGIGTTSPAYKFDLNSNAGDISFRTYTSTTNYSEHTYSKDVGFFIDSYQSVGGAPYTKTTDLIANADAGADSQLRLFTTTTGGNPTERMRITSSGNVGIGTVSPQSRLEIKGSNVYDSVKSITLTHAEPTYYSGFIGLRQEGLPYTNLTFGTRSGGVDYLETLNIGNGNVGIGTTSPSEKLDVNGNIKATSFIKSGGTSTQFLKADGSIDGTNYLQTLSTSINNSGRYLSISGGNQISIDSRLVHVLDSPNRNPNDPIFYPNVTGKSVRFDFIADDYVAGTGNYAGLMTFSPWDGTTNSTGDSSYQLAFYNQTGINGSGIPGLKIRKGIDTTWNSWYKVYTTGDFSQSNIDNWNAAYGWGNHASAGYLTSATLPAPLTSFSTSAWAGTFGYPGYQFVGGNSRFGFSSSGGIVDIYADGNFYATDSSYRVWHAGDFSSTNISNWNTAYGWGNHASAGYATTTYVNTQIANLVASAPAALDTLNELAAALGNDASFATTVTNSIASKLSLSGGTMTGQILFQTSALNNGFRWDVNSDAAGITFKNTGDGDNNSYFNFFTEDNGNEYFKFSHNTWNIGSFDYMDVKNGVVRTNGNIYVNASQSGSRSAGTNELINGNRVWHDGDFSSSNISNWNTAYGWGNHASAGYLKSSDLSNYVTTNTPQTITGHKEFQATDNIYYQTSLQVKGNGSTIYPGIGFHQPGVVGNQLNMANDGWFQFVNGSNSDYANLRVKNISSNGMLTFGNNEGGVYGVMGDNDAYRIWGRAAGSNQGYLEISTADDGNEPIIVSQYTGQFINKIRQAVLLDESGNTSFPGAVSANSIYTSTIFGTGTLNVLTPEGGARVVKSGGLLASSNYADEPPSLGIMSRGKNYFHNQYNGQPTISVAIGDNDTGFNWEGDGVISYYSNGVKLFNLNNVWHSGNFNPSSYQPAGNYVTIGTAGIVNYIPKFTASGAIGNSLIYDNGTSVGIGTTTPSSYKLNVNGDTNINGTLTATVKSFIIDHPTKPNKKLQYGVLEGPEHSVYFRGKLKGTNKIILPDYWFALVNEETITVNITPIGDKQNIWVVSTNACEIILESETEINCFYTVFAERKDINKLVTEFDK